MLYQFELAETVREALTQRTVSFPDQPMWSYQSPDSTAWIYKTSVQFAREVENVGAWLLEHQIENKKVAILSENSYEWVLLFYAVTCSGSVAVPLDHHLKAEELGELIAFNDCDVVFFSADNEEKVKNIEQRHTVVCYEMAVLDDAAAAEPSPEARERFRGTVIDPSDTAVIMFTSGTSGRKKGVELTHKNIGTNVTFSFRQAKFWGRYYNIIPSYHILGIFSLFVHLWGCCVYLSRGLTYLTQDFLEIKPTYALIVPALIPKFYDLYRLLGTDMQATLISGGAANEAEWIERLKTLNVSLYFGYGMTEMSPVIAVSSELFDHHDNSMKVLGCCEVRIDHPDADGVGEILVKGDTVMKGYYKMPEETARVLHDGWLSTGDLGKLDDEGFLTVVGRKKNILVLPNGENIAPEGIESKIMTVAGVEECMILCCEGVLTAEVYAPGAAEEEIRREIKNVNRGLPSYSRVMKIVFRKEPLPRNSVGKILRNAVN